jgi:hypothetical protein
MLRDPGPARANLAMQAMTKMVRLDIAGLQQACNQAARARNMDGFAGHII